MFLCAGLPGAEAGSMLPEDYFPELMSLLEHARDASPHVHRQSLRIEQAEGERLAASSATKPRANLQARAAASVEYRSDLDSTPLRGFAQTNLSVRQPLYHWGALRATRRIGELQLERTEAEGVEAREALLREIRGQYLQLVMLRRRESALERSLGYSEDLVSAQEELVRRNRLSETELLESRLSLYDTEEQLSSARNRVRRLEDRLAQNTGYDRVDALGRVAVPEIRVMSPEEMHELRRAIDRETRISGDVLAEQLELEMERERFQTLESRLRPNVDLVAGITQDQLEAVGSDDYEVRVIYFTGLQVSWNLFDGRETRGRKMSSLARQRLLEMRAERTRQMERHELNALYEEVQHNLRQMTTRERRSELTEQRLALQEELADRERISRTELLRERIAAEEIRIQSLEARLTYLENVGRLRARIHGDPFLQGRAGEPPSIIHDR